MFGRVSCVVCLCAGVLGGCDGEITPDASVTRDASMERDGGVDGGGVDGGLVADDAGAHALRVRSGVHMIGAANWIYDRRWFASTH